MLEKNESTEFVRSFVESLLPDRVERRRFLEYWVSSIVYAHDFGSEVWCVTVRRRRGLVRLNVGRCYAFDLMQGNTSILLLDERLDDATRKRLQEAAIEHSWGRPIFKVLDGAVYATLSNASFQNFWQEIQPAHQAFVRRAAKTAQRTPFFVAHSPALVDYLGRELGREIPRPAHESRGRTRRRRQQILDRVEAEYPELTGLRDERFVHDEIDYKRRASRQAQELLSEAALRRLLDEGAHQELHARLKKVGASTNLLFQGVPRSGDLAVLHHENLDAAAFGKALLDLLYGPGDSPERLGRYSAWADRAELPNRWAFPTCLLFLIHPQTEILIKPRVATYLLKVFGIDHKLGTKPNPEGYAIVREAAAQFAEETRDLGVEDMIDVQSLIWVSSRSKYDPGKDEPSKLVDGKDQRQSKAVVHDPYPVEQLADDVGLDVGEVERWIRAVRRKRQAILYGPPGTGKTWSAEHLARHLVAETAGHVELVQLHPAYAYEDFIQGIRPQTSANGNGIAYPMVPGRFLEFCDRARATDDLCVLIIDEINRANLSRVFGELMYLLEYRDRSIPLAGGGTLQVPSNVVLLGTMNTADRSIALVDHALRRRFAFFHLAPNYASLRSFHDARETGFQPDGLIETLRQLNAEIGDAHYEVGTSFFLRKTLTKEIEDVWRLEIEPYLEEYFFDQRERMEPYRWHNVRERILA